ncbi:YbaK/EbsC family protein [Enterovibrio sp. ZSDZ35]|uniref:YbaK/EbsC family protein n=1 Tax=Enterovibrio qingdaonensis TaxID=2899818 RepID=A0ABT5QP02_9GAMM|nr:YbaK/EbsC family protein [Enterovibrio sp. ZSDZ35]MDD1782723.1 YbaK/EbsC family protein [Enterovibrio sp. ZSDZ35]
MSLEAVTDYFSSLGMENRILVMDKSTATVDEAAKVHKVDPDQIAKTLSFKVDETPILIVVSGASKIDNKKYKQHFQKKAKMLSPDEVLDVTGHAVGGVCPFGLPNPVEVFLDISLKKHDEVIPAAGGQNSAIRLTLPELEIHSQAMAWVDVCKE